MKRGLAKIIVFLVLILILVTIAAFLKGAVNIPLREFFFAQNRPILYLRLFRVFMAIVAGSGLAVSGIVLQGILKNSLAEPYILGTSSGAGLGAIIAIVMGLSGLYLPLAAFCGALLSIILVYNLAMYNNRIHEQALILSGVIVSVALSAIIVFLVSVSGEGALRGITWWLWGSLQVYDFKLLVFVSLIVFFGIAGIYVFAQDLNAISIGDDDAIHLGVDIKISKRILIIFASLITAALVCICGIIGFVGLIIPHMMRLIVGPNHKVLIPVSCLGAAVFMVGCDLLARSIAPPLEIPIGVITAIVGAPAFIILLKRKQKIR